jgi:hypothetical protein
MAKLAKTDLAANMKRPIGHYAYGRGKSMLFMSPAAISPEGGMAVVVVPPFVLQIDLHDY